MGESALAGETIVDMISNRKQFRNVSEVGDNMGVARGKGYKELIPCGWR